jgi:hypothetical protein
MLKSSVIDAIKAEGITADAVTITSRSDRGMERRDALHSLVMPALVIVATFARDIGVELRARVIERIVDAVMESRSEGDPVAEHVEEVILYDSRNEPMKVIERRRIER